MKDVRFDTNFVVLKAVSKLMINKEHDITLLTKSKQDVQVI